MILRFKKMEITQFFQKDISSNPFSRKISFVFNFLKRDERSDDRSSLSLSVSLSRIHLPLARSVVLSLFRLLHRQNTFHSGRQEARGSNGQIHNLILSLIKEGQTEKFIELNTFLKRHLSNFLSVKFPKSVNSF